MNEKDKVVKAFLIIILVLFLTTAYVHYAEKWSWVDSFYFSGITMSTIGYGDLHPTKDETKIVITLASIFLVGVFFYTLSTLSELRINKAIVENIKLLKDIDRIVHTKKKKKN